MIPFDRNCGVNEIFDTQPNNIPSHYHKRRIPHGYFSSSTIAPFTIVYRVHGNAPYPMDYTKYLVEVRSVIHDGVTDISENKKMTKPTTTSSTHGTL